MLENRLPAALRNRGAALALSIVVMLAAFFGLGGAKLKAKYNSASQWFPYGVAADNGYTLNEELLTRLNTAANVITTGMGCVFNGISVRHFLLSVQKASSTGLRLEICLPAYTWIRLSGEVQKFPSTYSCHRIYTLIVFDFRRMSIILWKIDEI